MVLNAMFLGQGIDVIKLAGFAVITFAIAALRWVPVRLPDSG